MEAISRTPRARASRAASYPRLFPLPGKSVGFMPETHVVILAAGKGTRMKSQRPKVLHRLAGRALVEHVMGCAQGLQARSVVLITGHGDPAAASEAEQDYRAALLYSRSGSSPWPVCG